MSTERDRYPSNWKQMISDYEKREIADKLRSLGSGWDMCDHDGMEANDYAGVAYEILSACGIDMLDKTVPIRAFYYRLAELIEPVDYSDHLERAVFLNEK